MLGGFLASLFATKVGTRSSIVGLLDVVDELAYCKPSISKLVQICVRTSGHAAIGVICDGLTAFQKVAGKAKKIDTLRKLPSDLLDSMDQVTH